MPTKVRWPTESLMPTRTFPKIAKLAGAIASWNIQQRAALGGVLVVAPALVRSGSTPVAQKAGRQSASSRRPRRSLRLWPWFTLVLEVDVSRQTSSSASNKGAEAALHTIATMTSGGPANELSSKVCIT